MVRKGSPEGVPLWRGAGGVPQKKPPMAGGWESIGLPAARNTTVIARTPIYRGAWQSYLCSVAKQGMLKQVQHDTVVRLPLAGEGGTMVFLGFDN